MHETEECQGGCSNQHHQFVRAWWELCIHLIRSNFSNNVVSIYLQRRSDMLDPVIAQAIIVMYATVNLGK